MSSHKRHSHTSGNTRFTTTASSNGTITHSTSTGGPHSRTTHTMKSNGDSYTTYTTRSESGWSETKRVSDHHKEHKHHSNNTRQPFYSREDREELRLMRMRKNRQSSLYDYKFPEEDWVELPKRNWYFITIGLTAFAVFMIFYFTTILPFLL